MTTRNAFRLRITSLLTLLLPLAGTAAASPSTTTTTTTAAAESTTRATGAPGRHHGRMALELAGVLAIGNQWYWRDNGQPNAVDWQLEHDMSAVRTKLGDTDGWRFDGNEFDINALGHPGFGMLTHVLGRQNGYTLAETFLISTVVSGTWEVFLELAEYGSVNDMLSTSTAGIPLGETAYQIAHHLDETRFEVRAGAGADNGEAFGVVSARGDLNRVPSSGDGYVRGGRKVDFTIAAASDDEGVRSLAGSAKANLVGYYRNRIDRTVFAGISSEFEYRNQHQRAERAWDLLSTVSAGPTLEVQLRRGEVTVDVGADLFVDFAMVKAQAYDAWRVDHPTAIVRNVMQDKVRPYYYAMGASLDPRINLSYRRLSLGGAVTGRVLGSIDGVDRDQEMLTSDAHISDRDTRAEASLGYRLDRMSLVLDGAVSRRSGSMGDAHGASTGRTAMVTFGYRR